MNTAGSTSSPQRDEACPPSIFVYPGEDIRRGEPGRLGVGTSSGDGIHGQDEASIDFDV